jgi:hypothetical protein
MSLPSTVTSRAEGNEFVASTGITLTGVTGFGLRTGFYLTNSGNYPVRTDISYYEAGTQGVFEFPSGQRFDILAGQSKFIPFEMVFVQDNISGPAVGATGPETNGLWTSQFSLSTISKRNGQDDPSGAIKLNVTGQVTGFQAGSGPFTSTIPAHPSGFLVTTDYALDGKPTSTLRWQHPSSGYYFTKYKIEYAGNIEDSSVATGSWTGLYDFDINRSLETQTAGVTTAFTYYKYATNTGIAQKFTRGTADNPETPYGEFSVSDLAFNANYYYRIKSQYVDRDGSIYYESPYVYGYPVDNFNVDITNADVNGGLLSGSTTLSPTTDPSDVIANNTSDPQALQIYFQNGQTNINLKTEFDKKLTAITGSVNIFDPTHADYAFSGVHFTVPENYIVGANTTDNAGIDTGAQLKYGSTEIKSVLFLKEGSQVLGMGGKGGNGGFTTINLSEEEPHLFYRGRFNIGSRDTTTSDNVGAGSAAIYISDTSIGELQIRKDPTAKIYGGGGGGGGGDSFYFPKAFVFNPDALVDITQAKVNSFKRLHKLTDTPNIKLTTDLKESPEASEFDIQASYAVNRTQNGKSYKWSYNTLNFTLADIIGDQLGGLGGGGQGFGESLGGSSKKQGTDATFGNNKGSSKAAGLGSQPNGESNVSPGGDGGEFGVDGKTPRNADAGILYPIPDDNTGAAVGGQSGEAIKIVTGNSNYSKVSSLVQYESSLQPTSSNYPNLVAWFTTEDSSSTYLPTTTVGSYKEIDQWKAKNDTSIYIDFYNGTNSLFRPMLIEQGTTTNHNCYTLPFNNNNVVFFGFNQSGKDATGGDLHNIIGTNKLQNSMTGFEIVYFMYPGTVEDDSGNLAFRTQFSSFYVKDGGSNVKKGNFNINGSAPRYRNGKVGYALHEWSTKTDTLDQSDNYASSLFYYKNEGAEGAMQRSSENAGLPFGYNINFSDFTNGVSPQRAWMYSVSSFRAGSLTNYQIYNDLSLVTERRFEVSSYNWRTEPRIGYNRGYNANCQSFFYGCISDIVVFNTALTPKQRKSLYAYISNRKLKVKASANRNDELDRNTIKDQNGFAGFNIGPSW